MFISLTDVLLSPTSPAKKKKKNLAFDKSKMRLVWSVDWTHVQLMDKHPDTQGSGLQEESCVFSCWDNKYIQDLLLLDLESHWCILIVFNCSFISSYPVWRHRKTWMKEKQWIYSSQIWDFLIFSSMWEIYQGWFAPKFFTQKVTSLISNFSVSSGMSDRICSSWK